jgi:hypothetical protein
MVYEGDNGSLGTRDEETVSLRVLTSKVPPSRHEGFPRFLEPVAVLGLGKGRGSLGNERLRTKTKYLRLEPGGVGAGVWLSIASIGCEVLAP